MYVTLGPEILVFFCLLVFWEAGRASGWGGMGWGGGAGSGSGSGQNVPPQKGRSSPEFQHKYKKKKKKKEKDLLFRIASINSPRCSDVSISPSEYQRLCFCSVVFAPRPNILNNKMNKPKKSPLAASHPLSSPFTTPTPYPYRHKAGTGAFSR